MAQEIFLDPGIRDWVLLPIMLVMLLVGIMRHYITILLESTPKSSCKAIKETQAIARSINLRTNANIIPYFAFEMKKTFLSSQFDKGTYLKSPPPSNQQNPDEPQLPPQLQDPAQAEAMMEGMKKNMFMMIPQMFIMGWVSTFFAGFVLIKLPFPLTLRFKPMLQRGIETVDMDVAWVSSLSWYFINLMGLRGVFELILGDGNSADGMRDINMAANMQQQQQQAMGQPQDMSKVFQSEKESLDLVVHNWAVGDAENRLVKRLADELLQSGIEVKKSQ